MAVCIDDKCEVSLPLRNFIESEIKGLRAAYGDDVLPKYLLEDLSRLSLDMDRLARESIQILAYDPKDKAARDVLGFVNRYYRFAEKQA